VPVGGGTVDTLVCFSFACLLAETRQVPSLQRCRPQNTSRENCPVSPNNKGAPSDYRILARRRSGARTRRTHGDTESSTLRLVLLDAVAERQRVPRWRTGRTRLPFVSFFLSFFNSISFRFVVNFCIPQHYADGHCSGLSFADCHYVTEFCVNGRHA